MKKNPSLASGIEHSTMRWLIPTSFEASLLTALAPFADCITFYGKAAVDPAGGGRSSLFLPAPSDDTMAAHIKEAVQMGFGFNYLLNATCCGSVLNQHQERSDLQSRIEWLKTVPLTEITVSNTDMMQVVRQHFPKVAIIMGFGADVDCLKKILRFAEAGVAGVTLSVDLNRDFTRLKSLLAATPIPLTLLATLTCLPACHRLSTCMNTLSHSSSDGAKDDSLPVTLPLFECSHEKTRSPWKILSAPFIRPEDVKVYEELGITTLKLTDRFNSTEEIIAKFKAYYSRSYSGNLLDLLSFGLLKKTGSFRSGKLHIPKAKVPALLAVDKLLAFSEMPDIYLDNQALDGFLAGFIRQNIACRDTDCTLCQYCHHWAKSALCFEGQKGEEAWQRYQVFLQKYTSLDSIF